MDELKILSYSTKIDKGFIDIIGDDLMDITIAIFSQIRDLATERFITNNEPISRKAMREILKDVADCIEAHKYWPIGYTRSLDVAHMDRTKTYCSINTTISKE